MTLKYFVNPFAVAGDVTPIPDPVQVGGEVSYSQGFGPDYSLPYPSNPAALTFPRKQFNQLMFDITSSLQQLQSIGVFPFITSAMNDGTPYPYNKYAFCIYDDGTNGPRIFQSLMNGNTNMPASQRTIQPYTASGNILTLSSTTPYFTGAAVTVSSTGTLPSPLVAGTIYYVINISSTEISLATSLVNALANIPITLSGVGSGSQKVIIPISWQWVNNTAAAVVIDNAPTFESSVVNGNVVYWDSANNWYAKAIADGSNAQNVVGIADVTFSRVFAFGDISPLIGLTGLTPGVIYYLSSTTAGAITATPPTNSALIQVGVAKSATELFLNIQVSSNKATFSAVLSAPQSISGSGVTQIELNTIDYDLSGSFNDASYIFQPTIPGYYFFIGSAAFSAVGVTSVGVYIFKNGVEQAVTNSTVQSGESPIISTSAILFMNGTTDYVDLRVNEASGASYTIATQYTFLQGFRIV